MSFNNPVFNTPTTAFPTQQIVDDSGNVISPNSSNSNSNPNLTFNNNSTPNNSSNTTTDTAFDPRSASFYFPLASTVHTWNTKRLLPSALLSQYTPFSCLFLIDDLNGSIFTSQDTDLGGSILFGAPTDTVAQIASGLYDTSKYKTNPNTTDKLHTTKFFSDALDNNVYKLGTISGIPATIKGYNGNSDVNLIPLCLKMSQLTTPDARGILELGNIQVDYISLFGYVTANLQIVTYDINQMFAMQTVASRLFQSFNRYLLVFGWQGPSIENIDFSSDDKTKYGISDTTINGSNSMTVNLLDGSQYDMYLPSPFVTPDGLLNFPNDGTRYKIDLDDTDNGNRQMYALYGVSPQIKFEGTKVTVDMKATNAGGGFNAYTPVNVLIGGEYAVQRKAILDKINNELKPIANFNVANFIDDFGIDAESQAGQDLYKSLKNNINAQNPSQLLFGRLSQSTATVNETQNTDASSTPNASVSKNQKSAQIPQPTQYNIDVFQQPYPAYPKDVTIDGIPTVPPSSKQYNQDFLTNLNNFVDYINNNFTPFPKIFVHSANSIYGVRTFDEQASQSGGTNPNKHASMHQIGLATDLGGGYGNINFKNSNSNFDNLNNVAANFNLVFPYPSELWHVQRNGPSSDGNGFTNNSIPDETQPGQGATNTIASTNSSNNNQTQTPTTPSVSTSTQPSIITLDTSTITNLGGVTVVPAAYRLGDIITTLSEVMDEYFLNYQGTNIYPLKGIINSLQVHGITQITINGTLKNVNDLTYEDVFSVANDGTTDNTQLVNYVNQSFKDAVKQVLGTVAQTNDAFTKLFFSNAFDSIAESIGFAVIAENIGKGQYDKFLQMLNYYESTVCGTTIKNMEDNSSKRNIMLHSDWQAHLFTWDNDYINSFTNNSTQYPFEPISVGDIPISVDTLSRIMQNIPFIKSLHEFINQILLYVSLDYGFSLRMIYRTFGSSRSELLTKVIRDYEMRTSTNSDYNTSNGPVSNPNNSTSNNFARRKTIAPQEDSTNHNDVKINFIIDDQFLTEKHIVDELSSYASTVQNNPLAHKKYINNQPDVYPKIKSEEDGNNKSLINQVTFLENEYSKEKLNDTFIIDYSSIHSIIKSVSFGSIDGVYNMQNQAAINLLAAGMNKINGQQLPPLSPEQQGIVKNFTAFQGQLSDQIIKDYGYMPGTKEFEIRFLKQLSETFDDINNNSTNPNSSTVQNNFVSQQLAQINSQNSFVSPQLQGDSRKDFLQQILANYLYNRPMGVKYAFFTGKLSVDIHGTSGLGIAQGIYARGLISSMDAYYSISKVTHSVSKEFWNTHLESTIVGSDVLTENLSVLKSYSSSNLDTTIKNPFNNGSL